MFNVCYHCGQYRVDKEIDPSGPAAICPLCGWRHPFRMLPLLVVGGASGAGKSSVLQMLAGQFTQAVLLEGDLLWRPEFNQPETGYRDFLECWLRLAKNIHQSGRPTVIFNAGMGVPANIEGCVERRYFSQVKYLALVCGDQALETRLKARPAWRESGRDEWIRGQQDFNRWLREKGPAQGVELLDTSGKDLAQTAGETAEWIIRQIKTAHFNDETT